MYRVDRAVRARAGRRRVCGARRALQAGSELRLPSRQGDRRADGRADARVLRRVGVRRRGRVQDATRSDEFMATGKDAYKRGFPQPTVEFARARLGSEARGARGRRRRLPRRRSRSYRGTRVRARRRRPGLRRAASCSTRAWCARVAACDPAASRRAISRALSSSSAVGTQSETRPIRSAVLAVDGLAQEQVVLRLGEPAEERPHDHGVIAGRDAEPRVAVDDRRRRSGDADVREQRHREPGADCRAVDRRDDRLAAVDDVVDEVARLVEDAQPRVPVLRDLGRPGRGRRRS